jgi:UDP-N-acetylglucosamine:LPS N-acetylglucosamine transferase
MGQVLFSPLNWGLGHAMRDIPVIKILLDHGHEVTIAACGNALMVLQREFPSCRFIEFKDYPSPYSTGRFFLPKLALYFPVLLQAVARERREAGRIISRSRYDLVISDNRLGVYSSKIPSLFITHQLHFHLPAYLWPVELSASVLNRFHHRKFDRVIVPDNPPGPLSLAGKLSRPDSDSARARAFFAGILTSIPRQDIPRDLDYLVLISGPEPQRSRLEEILLPMAKELDGRSVILLGSPQKKPEVTGSGDCSVRTYVTNEEKAELMNRAKFVICRSGYTTMMELAELKKKPGLFIPTPGQTEQEYLSRYYEQKGWFHSRSQYHLDLPADIDIAGKYTGFPEMPGTMDNVRHLYNDLLAGYLE